VNWLRAHRRYIVAIAALAVMSLALVRYVCPLPLDGANVLSAAQSSASAMSLEFCGPEGCTYAPTDSPAPDLALQLNSLVPLLVAVFFLVLRAFSLAHVGTQRARTFRRLPGFPPILEFYRLRI